MITETVHMILKCDGVLLTAYQTDDHTQLVSIVVSDFVCSRLNDEMIISFSVLKVVKPNDDQRKLRYHFDRCAVDKSSITLTNRRIGMVYGCTACRDVNNGSLRNLFLYDESILI